MITLFVTYFAFYSKVYVHYNALLGISYTCTVFLFNMCEIRLLLLLIAFKAERITYNVTETQLRP